MVAWWWFLVYCFVILIVFVNALWVGGFSCWFVVGYCSACFSVRLTSFECFVNSVVVCDFCILPVDVLCLV